MKAPTDGTIPSFSRPLREFALHWSELPIFCYARADYALVIFLASAFRYWLTPGNHMPVKTATAEQQMPGAVKQCSMLMCRSVFVGAAHILQLVISMVYLGLEIP